MRLEITAQAWRDIASINQTSLEQFGAAQAAKYVTGLLNLLDLIASKPHLARVRRGFARPYRAHRHGSHVVFYRIEEDRVIVSRILHGKQNWNEYL